MISLDVSSLIDIYFRTRNKNHLMVIYPVPLSRVDDVKKAVSYLNSHDGLGDFNDLESIKNILEIINYYDDAIEIFQDDIDSLNNILSILEKRKD